MKKTINLPQELIESANKVAKQTGATFSGLIRISLEKEIENAKTNRTSHNQTHEN